MRADLMEMIRKNFMVSLIREVVRKDERAVFAYLYGSFVNQESFRDIDVGVYLRDAGENSLVVSAELKTQLSRDAQKHGFSFAADHFDVKILNDAPFTFLRRVFEQGILLFDRNPELRTDLIEYVSLKYRECAGILAEASS
jgi:uncharacterized protein